MARHVLLRRQLWSIAFSVVLLASPAGAAPSAVGRADWMRDARWGTMTHYLADWQWGEEAAEKGLPARGSWRTLASVERWNERIDRFDVEGLAQQLADARVSYHILTLGQNSGYYLAPNATYDEIVGIRPSKCARRDLVSDLADALAKRGIRLMVYLPSGAPNGDADAVRALQWRDGAHPNLEFRTRWERIVRDWSRRFGRKVSGWWFDGAYWPNTMYRGETSSYETLAAAARAGNPDSAVAFCPGVIFPILSVTPFEDYTAGEAGPASTLFTQYWPPRVTDGKVDGAQLQMLSYLGRTWGRGAPRDTPEQVVAWTRNVVDRGGAATWDIPPLASGRFPDAYRPHLRALAAAFAATGGAASAAGAGSVESPPPAMPTPIPSPTPTPMQVVSVPRAAAHGEPRAAWMARAQWGLMLEDLADGLRREAVEPLNADAWNAYVDAFDVEALAGELAALNVPYVFVTVGRDSGFYAAPNATYDAIVGVTPSRGARRDLVGALGDALAKRNIRMLVALTMAPPPDDATAVAALQWSDGSNAAFRRHWERVVRDWSQRWGKRVAGWWFDGCAWPNAYRGAEPSFGSLAAAARAGNPEAAVAFNPGPANRLYSLTPHEDFTGGEVQDPEMAFPAFRRISEGSVDGARAHLVAVFRGVPETTFAWTRRVNAAGGAMTWRVDLGRDGRLPEETRLALAALSRLLAQPIYEPPRRGSARAGE